MKQQVNDILEQLGNQVYNNLPYSVSDQLKPLLNQYSDNTRNLLIVVGALVLIYISIKVFWPMVQHLIMVVIGSAAVWLIYQYWIGNGGNSGNKGSGGNGGNRGKQ